MEILEVKIKSVTAFVRTASVSQIDFKFAV